MIEYHEGDIFASIQEQEMKDDVSIIFLPHICNNQHAWGAGFVVPLGKTYPRSREDYMKHQPKMGTTQFSYQPNSKVVVANMVAQTLGGNRPLRYDALVDCMEQVADALAPLTNQGQIYCPLFGAGLAGGNWGFIHELIVDCWQKRTYAPVHIFYLKDKCPAGFLDWLNRPN